MTMSSKKKERMEMENNNSNSGSKFINGFLLGALIGAGVVFLLGTKKGKKLLKAISEEGLGNISNILEEEKVDDIDDLDEDKEVEKVIPSEEVRPKVRRFFRGIAKRLN